MHTGSSGPSLPGGRTSHQSATVPLQSITINQLNLDGLLLNVFQVIFSTKASQIRKPQCLQEATRNHT